MSLVPEPAEIVLVHLNEKAGRKFTFAEEHLKLIRKCLKACGGDVDGVKMMIDRQVALWGDTNMHPWLRPATLFATLNFRNYYDDRDQPVPNRFSTSSHQQYGRNPSIAERRNQFISGADDVRRAIASTDAEAPKPWSH